MEQERDGGRGEGGDMNKQLKEMQGDGQVVQSQPVPQQQKCPRCESVNTKFCYYNNYSLSQPRYFCKTCRRYWTHGGTLRNVPVGGGCRKGKRAKNSSSSSAENSSRSHPQPPPQDVVVQTQQPNLTTTLMRAEDPSSAAGSSHAAVPSISPYYQGDGGGYLSSLAAIHSPNPSHPFNQSLNAGVDVVGSSNLGLLSGFNVASLGSSQQHERQHVRPSQFYQMGGRERDVETLYAPEQGLIPSSMANSSAASHHDWPQTQSFISNANYRASDASLWSTISTTSINGNSDEGNNASAGSSSLIPNQWPDLPGYGPPP